MKFINLTRRAEIGANSYYLELGGKRLVLDSGMHPRDEGDLALPLWSAFEGRALDAILITHAHQDHIGTLPLLMRQRPAARTFMTEMTAEIGDALLHNSVNVMTRQREELGLEMYPLFTHREVNQARAEWHSCRYRQSYDFRGDRGATGDAPTFEFWDAGHVLGSTGVLLRGEGRTIFYTGDVNFDDQTIAPAAKFPETSVDLLIMECTRGDNATPASWTRAGEEEKLAAAIARVFARGGCVLIPVFALGKTQEVLAMLHKFQRRQLLERCPIYIGGLSAKMTEIYDRYANQARRQLTRLQLLSEVAPFVLNGKTFAETTARGGRIYALSSGMMTPKTLSNIFARRVLDDPRHAIFFVGYADPASPGGILQAAKIGDEVTLDPALPAQTLRCETQRFQFSSHASRESLVAFARRLAPAKILLVHGDPGAMAWMRAELQRVLPQAEIMIPPSGVELDL